MTDRQTRITNIIEKRRPLAQKIAATEVNLRTIAAALENLEGQRHQLIDKVDDPTVAGRLEEINFSNIQADIFKELEALGKLKARFSRDTLNIGVVGRARQGKSRLLQSLTGLRAAEIPDGDRQHCTGVRSTIHHNPNGETYGEVWFHSEQSFLDEVIAPYFEQLKLGRKPLTIQSFVSIPLPPLPSKLETQAEAGAKYEHLRRYHNNFDKYSPLLQTASPRRISQKEIREYVAQDTPDGQRIFYNYLAVKEVKIVCSFPNEDVGKIALVDMPGLGDTGIGDQERLIQTLARDVDFILFVRMPKPSGDYWADVDVKLYDIAASALLDLPVNLWSFMTLNRTSAESKNGDNSNNCLDLAETMAEKHLQVVDHIIANCGDVEEANTKILDRVLDYLANQIDNLDNRYAKSTQQHLFEMQKNIQSELEKAQNALGTFKNIDSDARIFQPLFKQRWKAITNGLEQLLKELRNKREEVDIDFNNQVDSAILACKNDSGIPSIDEIERRNNEEGSYDIAYNKYLNEIRAHLSQQFLSLDEGLKSSLDRVKSQVAEVLIYQGYLGNFTEARGADFIKAMAEQLPEELISSQRSKLKFGFQILAEFELSYRGFVQHRIRQHLDGLTPNEPTTKQLGKSPNANQVLICLKTSHAQAVYKCQSALGEFLSEPSQAAFAMVEEFLDRILRAADVETEWRIFIDDIRDKVWPHEFQKLRQRNQLRRDWLEFVDKAKSFNQASYMDFLN